MTQPQAATATTEPAAKSTQTAPCPCGTGDAYDKCCGRYVDHHSQVGAPTAEALMRSRFTAHARGDVDYILKTCGGQAAKNNDRAATGRWVNSVTWERLEIVATEDGASTQNDGMVEFKAHYIAGGHPQVLHERARFSKGTGRWLYVGGDVMGEQPRTTVKRQEPKVGRNDPCPCGSGKKHKRCCG